MCECVCTFFFCVCVYIVFVCVYIVYVCVCACVCVLPELIFETSVGFFSLFIFYINYDIQFIISVCRHFSGQQQTTYVSTMGPILLGKNISMLFVARSLKKYVLPSWLKNIFVCLPVDGFLHADLSLLLLVLFVLCFVFVWRYPTVIVA